MKKILLIIHTIIHLRPIQIRYQLWYRLRAQWRRITGFNYPLSIKKQGTPVKLQTWIEKPVSFAEDTFTFLNLSKKYKASNINWNETQHGKLWAYNLNYMDYLLQPGMDQATGLKLIDPFIQSLPQNPTGLDPYPIALRGINWIKFLSDFEDFTQRAPRQTAANAVTKKDNVSLRPPHESVAPAARNALDSSLYAQYQILLDKLEYHLLANHLLEDAFSLLFGAFYFKDSTCYKKAKQILTTELNEQILDDGAHFELSPMYHQIILDRLLDCINLLQNNQRFADQQQLLEMMQEKAKQMLCWLNNITFANGQIPLLNDAAPGIAPSSEQLNNYAANLNVQPETRNSKLGASGYRKFDSPVYECIIDVGAIGPAYQPGHAHADTFNFVLSVNQNPVIVDTGISTYEANAKRLEERGTAAHNTVTIDGLNSSEVWSSFRVGSRAKVQLQKDDGKELIAAHNGYRKQGTIHRREWYFQHDEIEIIDSLSGKVNSGIFHLHFAPGLLPELSSNTVVCKGLRISFTHAKSLNLRETKIPGGYNQWQANYTLEVSFKNQLITQLKTIN